MKAAKDNLLNYIAKKFNIDAHYFFHGGFWLSLGQAATLCFGLISTALFAHFLTPEQYGIYRYLIGISVILASFSLTGLGQSILQATAQKFTSFYKETLKINFLYSLTISLVAFSGASYYWFKDNNTLALGCLMVAVIQPFITTFQNSQSYLQGAGLYRESATLSLIRVTITTFVSVTILFVTKNIIVLFLFYLLGILVANLYGHNKFIIKSGNKTPPEFFSRYIKYAKHTSFRNAISNIAQRADSIIVFTQLGATELAIYSLALLLPEQIKVIFKNLATLLLPKYTQRSTDVLLKDLPLRSLQLLLVILFITVVFILLAPILYTILFPKYTEAAKLAQLFSLSLPAMIGIIPANIIQSKLDEKKMYILSFFDSVVLLSLTLIFTVLFGLIGTICARILYRYIVLIVSYLIVFSKT